MNGFAISELAVAHRRIGDVHWVSGDRDAGLDEYRTGLSLVRNVAMPTRDEPRVRRTFVRLSIKVGRGLVETGAVQKALQVQAEAEEVARAILDQDPENAQARVDLVDNLNLAGEIHIAAADPDAALGALHEAQELLVKLTSGNPEYTVLNASAKNWGFIGRSEAKLGRWDDAFSAFARSIAIRQSIVEGDPTSSKLEPLAVDYLALAEVYATRAVQGGCDQSCQHECWEGVLDSQRSALGIFDQLQSQGTLPARYDQLQHCAPIGNLRKFKSRIMIFISASRSGPTRCSTLDAGITSWNDGDGGYAAAAKTGTSVRVVKPCANLLCVKHPGMKWDRDRAADESRSHPRARTPRHPMSRASCKRTRPPSSQSCHSHQVLAVALRQIAWWLANVI
jgi:tetratricopeptide (TPR) repeat protein